jgi:hypothetical protein
LKNAELLLLLSIHMPVKMFSASKPEDGGANMATAAVICRADLNRPIEWARSPRPSRRLSPKAFRATFSELCQTHQAR